jgi:DNA-binding transcriptional regulator YdaS (Cro superfamily)
MDHDNTMPALRGWLKQAQPDIVAELCRKIGTSRATLTQYASGHRRVSAARAIEIDAAVRSLRAEGAEVPPLHAKELCPACAKCRYANAAD